MRRAGLLVVWMGVVFAHAACGENGETRPGPSGSRGSGDGGSTASSASGGSGGLGGAGGAGGGAQVGSGGDGGSTSASTSSGMTDGGGAAAGAGGGGGSWGAGGCGDGARDPATEECDDGPGDEDDACNAVCEVADQLASPGANIALEQGRHPVASGPSGSAVVFVDRDLSPPAPMLAAFGTKGKSLGAPLPLGPVPLHGSPASPVVAALPGGAYAVAWTDFGGDGDSRGIALQRIDPASAVQPAPIHANAQTALNQFDPDVLWTGTELVVAWVDDTAPLGFGDLRVRSFDDNLVPLGPEAPLAATMDAEARVALAPFAGSWAAAWRSAGAASEYVSARAGNVSWEVGPVSPAAVDDQPALVELDATHLLLVFTETDPAAAPAGLLSGAVIDLAVSGLTPSFPLAPANAKPDHSQASATRVGDRIFVTWRSKGAPGDPLEDEAWLRELAWDGSTLTGAQDALPLPRWPTHQVGDQRRPTLTATPLAPGGALLAAWDDWAAGASSPSVRLELAPTPILRP